MKPINDFQEQLLQKCDEREIVRRMINETNSEKIKGALAIADELADMIVFHAKVQSGKQYMLRPWNICDKN